MEQSAATANFIFSYHSSVRSISFFPKKVKFREASGLPVLSATVGDIDVLFPCSPVAAGNRVILKVSF